MMGDRLTQTSRKQRIIRRSVGRSLSLAAALCLPTGLAWAEDNTPDGNANGWNNSHNPHHSAPEIDSSIAVSALAILTGGVLLVGDRVRKSRRNREG